MASIEDLCVAYQFPIIVYPSEVIAGGKFTAHCLSTDMIADDDTEAGAVAKLFETLAAAVLAAQKHNANIFRRAPQEYWERVM